MGRRIVLAADLKSKVAELLDQGATAATVAQILERAGVQVSMRTIWRWGRARRVDVRRTEILGALRREVLEGLAPGQEVALVQAVEGLDLRPGWCFRRRTRLRSELRSFVASPTLAGFQKLKRTAMLFLLEWGASERLKPGGGSGTCE